MFDFSRIDDFLKRCDSSETDEQLRLAFRQYSAEFDLNLDADPFSDVYRARQMEIYSQLAGRPYSPANEVTAFDTEAAAISPFPYSHGSSELVGNQLISIGYVIRSMALPKGARVLEFGPGWGNTTLAMAKMGFQVTAVDIEKNFCRLIEKRASLERLSIEVINADFSYIDQFDPGRFDAVLFFECFHHSADHLSLMASFGRVVKPGGIVCFGAEPINGDFPIPWGLRMDGESIWAIRRNGWLELGFNDRYFDDAMNRNGWALTTHRSNDCPGLSAIIAKRVSEVGGSFSPFDGSLQTQIGIKSDNGSLMTTGVPGYLTYGPYISLPRGNYLASFEIDNSLRKSGVVVLDVAYDGGQNVGASSVVDLSKLNTDYLEFAFSLIKSTTNVEIRMLCDEGTRLAVRSLNICAAK